MGSNVSLDDVDSFLHLDRQGMLEALAGFPRQCREAAALSVDLPEDYAQVDQVVVCGMGGSAIVGDILRVLPARQLSVPALTVRDYELPGFVSHRTLLLASSYSGMTEETVGAMTLGLKKGAKVAAVSSGGRVEDICRERGLPLVKIPGGMQPRAALGYLLLPMLRILESLGLVEEPPGGANVVAAAERASKTLEEQIKGYGVETPVADNPAKGLALRLRGRLPVIYGSEELCFPAALRLKCQINENAKTLAFAGALPEIDHNEIVGWGRPAEVCRSSYLVFFRDGEDHPQVGKRMAFTQELVGEEVGGREEIWSSGVTPLERLLSLVCLGDWASVYLAFLNGVDPSPVDRISELKRRLAG